MWRLVLEGVATMEELRRSWSLDDVARANAYLDLRQEAQAEAIDRARTESKGAG